VRGNAAGGADNISRGLIERVSTDERLSTFSSSGRKCHVGRIVASGIHGRGSAKWSERDSTARASVHNTLVCVAYERERERERERAMKNDRQREGERV